MPMVRWDLPPARALAFFRAKGLQTSFDWAEMLHEEHDRAFTVAKMADMDLLRDVRDAVDRAIEQGQSLREFTEELTPRLQEAGWWGRREARDPKTGRLREVQLGSPRRLRTIYQTNMRTAYQAGHWSHIVDSAQYAPYLLYDAVLDSRTRPDHRVWDGTVLRWDDPWWATHYPPNGWRCRCSVVQLTERQMRRLGKSGPDQAPVGPSREWTNPATGEVELVPEGIDPGWGYHPGRNRLDQIHELLAQRLVIPAVPAAFASTAAEEMDRRIERWAATEDADPADYARRLGDRTRELVRRAGLWVRTDSRQIREVLDAGDWSATAAAVPRNWRTHIESTKIDYERRVLGADIDTSRAQRPVYGYLSEDAHGGLADQRLGAWGNVAVRLRPAARVRATATQGTLVDTIYDTPVAQPRPLVDPDHRMRRPGANVTNSRDPMALRRIDDDLDVWEAQIHGGLRIADIEEVVFSREPPKTVIRRLERAGVSWRTAPADEIAPGDFDDDIPFSEAV